MGRLLIDGFEANFKHLHPKTIAYTYWSYRFKARERNTGWRIDYFLISESLLPKVKSVGIFSEFMGSDHYPLCLEIEV
jgi:exodeoxyribonuclease-3